MFSMYMYRRNFLPTIKSPGLSMRYEQFRPLLQVRCRVMDGQIIIFPWSKWYFQNERLCGSVCVAVLFIRQEMLMVYYTILIDTIV